MADALARWLPSRLDRFAVTAPSPDVASPPERFHAGRTAQDRSTSGSYPPPVRIKPSMARAGSSAGVVAQLFDGSAQQAGHVHLADAHLGRDLGLGHLLEEAQLQNSTLAFGQ